ncbi:hypothetical protein B6G06_02335 [Actinomyces gaoshouyii]|nr:hypothetical protein B6G06_02335 [Actinomyces gaoshouyii]
MPPRATLSSGYPPVWRHTRSGDKYATVVIDLTPVHDGAGPARLLDMVPGRSKQVFKTWLADRPQAWRQGIEMVAMDGFTGCAWPVTRSTGATGACGRPPPTRTTIPCRPPREPPAL